MIASWSELLQVNEVSFDITQVNRMWHMTKNELGVGLWSTVQRMSLSRYANDPVGATWTASAARWLIQALVGYQHAFGPTAPQPMEITVDNN